MKLNFNCTEKEQRKKLVADIAELTGSPSKYLGMPSMAYAIGNATVAKDGTIEIDEKTFPEEAERIAEGLMDKGYEGEAEIETDVTEEQTEAEETQTEAEAEQTETAEESEADPTEEQTENTVEQTEAEEQTEIHDEETEADEADEDPAEEPAGLRIAFPRSRLSDGGIERLQKLLEAKGGLIKKALNIESVGIEIEEDRVAFPWFEEMPQPDEVEAYSRFICALCTFAENQKRVTAKEKPTDNEKFAFRTFLLRLGFIGDEPELKLARKVLLSRLTGSSAFRSGHKPEKTADSGAVSEAGDTAEETENEPTEGNTAPLCGEESNNGTETDNEKETEERETEE